MGVGGGGPRAPTVCMKVLVFNWLSPHVSNLQNTELVHSKKVHVC